VSPVRRDRPSGAGVFLCAVVAITITSAAPAAPEQPPAEPPASPRAPAGQSTVAPRSGVDTTTGARSTRQFSRFLVARTRNLSTLKLGSAEVAAHVGKLATVTDDYRALETLEPGTVLELPGAAASKFRTEVGLRFGEATLPTGNVSPGFAGLYSFWLRAPGEGSTEWRLVFNDEADVWGTQRDPARDRLDVPLEHEVVADEAKELTVSLAGQGDDGGLLELRWGPHRWRASFTAAPR
jgi:Protein of unknown function (DUF2911)